MKAFADLSRSQRTMWVQGLYGQRVRVRLVGSDGIYRQDRDAIVVGLAREVNNEDWARMDTLLVLQEYTDQSLSVVRMDRVVDVQRRDFERHDPRHPDYEPVTQVVKQLPRRR